MVSAVSALLLWLPAALCLQKAAPDMGHIQGYHTFSTPSDTIDNNNDPFAQNHRVKISWDDPLLRDRHWEGGAAVPSSGNVSPRSAIQKRAPTRKHFPSVWNQKHCLGCFKKAQGDRTDINDLTTENLVKVILVDEDKLENKCVFYTGVPDTERKTQGAKLGLGEKENLSAKAAEYACSKGMYSLWTLFPGETGNVGPNPTPDDLNTHNYWEIDRPGSWLYHLSGAAYRFTYFENMSRAMARMCKGKVWVYSLNPKNLKFYGSQTDNNNAHSIWNKVEHKELVDRRKTTMLIGIDAVTKEMFELDLATLNYKQDYKGTVPRDLEHLLEKRDTCNQNLMYQAPGDDWFGTGRRSYG